MKVLYLPLNAGDQPQQGMYDAFRDLDYVDLHIFDYYKKYAARKNLTLVCQEFVETVENVQPDWVHM